MEENISLFIKDMGIDSLEDIVGLYQDFMDECNQLVLEIEKSFEENSFDMVFTEKLLHNLKGVSANLYVNEVFEKATILDDLLKTQDKNSYVYKEMFHLWQQVLAAYTVAKVGIINYFLQRGYNLTS
ncbi:MAG: hypothetical protein CVU84_16200 [Firmicutes bacterium HGW-Firmicutes-1]|jgi:HPt (histidine-containing phosphotransfer) domain-containing protein|nr:MAG: hypothetical protein CVU84_16200 [Firmicutes bacterium HGW-Firmicutes-1]